MGIDMTSFDAALKQFYTKDRVQSLVYQNNPLLALLRKREDFGGRNMPVPVISGNPANRSAVFATAQAGTSASKVDAFLLTRVKDYSLCQIDNEVLEASKGDSGAFLEAATTEIDGALNALTRSVAIKIYRDGWGDVGRINATVSGTTLTLQTAGDVSNFERNMVLNFASSQSVSTLRSGSVTVVSVDRSAGSMVVSADLSTITGLTSGDWIFLAGDRVNSASPSRVCISGLGAWLPSSAPSSTAFFGVDRSTDPSRLGGQRFAANGGPIEEAVISGSFQCAKEGGKPDYAFMSFDTYANLVNALGAKVQFPVIEKISAQIGFQGIQINGANGPIKCLPDVNCPAGLVYVLQLNTWTLNSLGPIVRTYEGDIGSPMLRQANADGVEVRCLSYGNLSCSAPGFNARITL